MTKHLLLLLLTVSISLGGPIETRSLDSVDPMTIEVGSKTVTSLLFPDSVQSVAGFGLTSGGDEPGTYHFTHDAQNNLVLLRNIMPGKRCTMTVLMKSVLYVFELVPSDHPMIAVTLTMEPEASAREVSTESVVDQRIDYTPERLFTLMKLARQEKVLKPHLPEYYKDAESREVAFERDYGSMRTTIRSVTRFNDRDAFVFAGQIINQGGDSYSVDTANLRILVGRKLLPIAVIHLEEPDPETGSAEFECVVMGNAFGGKEHLAISNEFFLLLSPETSDSPASMKSNSSGRREQS